MTEKSVPARRRRWQRREIAPTRAPGARLLFRLGQRLVQGQITIEEYRALARVAKQLAIISRLSAFEGRARRYR